MWKIISHTKIFIVATYIFYVLSQQQLQSVYKVSDLNFTFGIKNLLHQSTEHPFGGELYRSILRYQTETLQSALIQFLTISYVVNLLLSLTDSSFELKKKKIYSFTLFPPSVLQVNLLSPPKCLDDYNSALPKLANGSPLLESPKIVLIPIMLLLLRHSVMSNSLRPH